MTQTQANSQASNVYSILGISQDANVQEARAAFRAIAKSCHPDLNPDPKAQELFVAAEAAYRAITGASASVDRIAPRPSRVNRMTEIELPVSIWTAAAGGMVKGECAIGKANIRVPAGARSGDRILARIGATDIACVVKIKEADGFRADGGDITSALRISSFQAKNGGFAEIETPVGRLRIKVPVDTPDGARLRVEGKGLAAARNRSQGHLYLDVEIVETMTDKAVSALDKILVAAKRPRESAQTKKSTFFGFGKKAV